MPQDAPGLAVPARRVPAPASISAEARAFLDLDFPMAAGVFAHDDKPAWRAYVAAVEPRLVEIARMRAAPFPAAIAEHALSNAMLYELTPETHRADRDDRAILHIHGGGFIAGGGLTAAYVAQTSASLTGIRAFSVDYRMPPDDPFPRGLDDCVEAYRFLLDRYEPSRIAVEGSSAGANLVGATILRARDEGLPLPGACVLHTAAMDLTDSGDSFVTNQQLDVVLRTPHPELMALYAGGADRAHPYLSPVFADLNRGFPPSMLVTGTRDLLLSPTVMMHRALRRAGIEAELHVFEAMPHGGFGGASPEDRELQAEIAGFIARKLA